MHPIRQLAPRAPRCAAILCLAAALGALAAPTRGDARQIRLDIREHTLDNGVKVLVWPRPSAGRIGARVFYRVDIAAERPGTVGLTHMLEHYLFMGSRHVGTSDWEAERPAAEAVERTSRALTDEQNRERDCFRQRDVFAEVERSCSTARIDSLQTALDAAFAEQQRYARGTDFDWIYQPAGGTGLTASTGRDWMKFDIDLPANRLELFMWAERSRVEHPVFRFFEPEREVVVDQIRRADNRPDGRFDRVLRSMTYDAHPYGWAHWFSDLTRATREDHWEIFYKHFIPQNTIIVIVGEVDPDEVFRLAERYWGSWLPGRPSPRLRTVEPPPVGQKRLVVDAPAGPALVMHVPMPAVGHPDTPVFEMLAEIVAGDQGRLTRALVDGGGAATRTSASAAVAKYPSHFALRVDARGNDDLPALEAGVDSVLAALERGDVTAAELQGASNRLVQAMARGLEQIGSSAVQIGAMESIHDWRLLNELPARWAGVTATDIAGVVDRYFRPEMRVVGVLRRGDAPVAGIPVKAVPAADAGRVYGGALDPSPLRDAGADRPGIVGSAAVAASAVPLPVAEQPWYAPPWLAGRRPSAFTEPAPVDHWRDFRFTAQPFDIPEPATHLRRLSNGVQAILVPDTLLPIVQVSALVDARTLVEPAGQEGIATLVAELLRAGAGGLDRAAIDAELQRIGGTLNVSVDHNRTRLHIMAPAAAGAGAARLIGRLVGRPTFDAAAFDAERDRQALRAARAQDDANARLRALFHRTLYGEGHPFGRAATAETVRAITISDARAFHARHYAPGSVIFAASGAFDSAAIEAALADGFGVATASPAGPDRARIDAPAPRAPEGRVVVTEEFDSRQAHVMFGHLGLDGVPADHAALEVMHHILTGGAFVSRMMEQLRTRTGITAAQYGAAEPGRGTRYPYVWRFSGNPETLARGIRLALDEIRNVRENGITAEEFEAARTSYIDGLIPAEYDTPHRTAERLAHVQLFGVYAYRSTGYLNYYAGDATQVAALHRLTLDDVNRAAREYLDPDNLVIAVVGPLAEIRAAAGENAALVQ